MTINEFGWQIMVTYNNTASQHSVCVSSVLTGQLFYEFLERCKFANVDKPELLHEEDEVLEGGAEMRLLLQLDHLVEVLVVDVRVNPEQSPQDCLRNRQEVLWEGHT